MYLLFAPIALLILMASVKRRVKAGGRNEGGYLAYSISVPINSDEETVRDDLERLEKFLAERSKKGYTYSIVEVLTRGTRRWLLLVEHGNNAFEDEVIEALRQSMKSISITPLRGITLRRLCIPYPLLSGSEKPELGSLTPPRSMGLSYPRRRLILYEKPEVPIGRALSIEGEPLVGLRREELFRHILIVGATGSGKTTTAASIGLRASSLVNTVILDWHDEYLDILGEGASAYDPPSLNLLDRDSLEEVVDVFEQVFDLSLPQSFALYRLLEDHPDIRSLGSLIDFLSTSPSEGYWDREVKQALLRRLYMLARDKHLFRPTERGVFLRTLRGDGRVSIVRVGSIGNTELRRLYTIAFLKAVYDSARRGEVRGLLVIVDEAHNVFNADNKRLTFTDRLIAEVRKYDVGLVLVTQSTGNISSVVVKNTNTKIIHTVKSGTDVHAVSSALGLDRRLRELLPYLPRGEAIVNTPSLPEPVVVRVSPPWS